MSAESVRASARLRALLRGGEILVAPGVFDGLSARLVERAGFSAVYASGGAIARAMGYPDLGLLSMTEVLDRLGPIVDAVRIPVIADADTGYGNALNVRRTVQAFERAGVAGLHLEDQSFPKRCGHYANKALISSAEMAQKLRAAREAVSHPDLVLIARTDAIAVEGLDAAIERALRYREAGADLLFVEAPESEAQIEEIGRRLPFPKLINLFQGSKTPFVPFPRLIELDYRVVIIPSDLQRAAIHAMADVLEAIKRDGSSAARVDRMVSFSEREAIVDTDAYERLSDRYRP